MQEIAYAKLNLALHVRAREPDGYHRIETIFAFCEGGDVLSVASSERLSLSIRGPFAEGLSDGPDNLVLRAAEALRARYGVVEGAALTLDKRLPVASGIGGGSADAAAALRLLSRFWSLSTEERDLLAVARSLGADVPACLRSEPARGEGRGDELAPISDFAFAGAPVLLVNPRVPVATAAVFAAWDGVDRGPLTLAEADRNDLEPPALRIAPEIGQVLNALRARPGATLVRMSGSGATCFALFESESDRDAAAAQLERSDWWQLATELRERVS